ncbi:Protein GLUTAMINE DUMPER 3 [Camellia lanceoleosa]|uniref:Protein GLUTAMINE DUMPER 3 n=1 Tax=Camellia lanceoleosa TaxID=1840588 RepID=A0ACC0HX38_9ERIC|nr:Protein GLUTAMINE DUMPER 3 [Camellia lanceoleosa]
MAIRSTAPTASPWNSPVPYLFGGLAAMLGLIAFALLILACSYWRLSGHLDGHTQQDDANSSAADDGDIELGRGGATVSDEKPIPVIMPGQKNPTFLATPVSSRASSFGSNGLNSQEMAEKSEGDDRSEKAKQLGSGDQVQIRTMETHDENSDQMS